MASSFDQLLVKELSTQDAHDLSELDQRMVDNAWLRERAGSLRFKRSTFTASKALQVKPYIDKAIATSSSILVPAAHFPAYKIETLYKIVTDSLLYLRTKIPIKHAAQYNELKKKVRIEKQTDGVLIRYTNMLRNETVSADDFTKSLADRVGNDVVVQRVYTPVVRESSATDLVEKLTVDETTKQYDPTVQTKTIRTYAEIQHEIAEYIDGDHKELREWGDLKLSLSEIEFLVTLFNRVGAVCTINEGSIRVMR